MRIIQCEGTGLRVKMQEGRGWPRAQQQQSLTVKDREQGTLDELSAIWLAGCRDEVEGRSGQMGKSKEPELYPELPASPPMGSQIGANMFTMF